MSTNPPQDLWEPLAREAGHDLGFLLAALRDVIAAIERAHREQLLSAEALVVLNDPSTRAKRAFAQVMSRWPILEENEKLLKGAPEAIYEPFLWNGERGTAEYYAAAIAWHENHCAACNARLVDGECPNQALHELEEGD